MAYYKDLPIWRDAMRLAVEMELAVRGFPRYHKYTLGTELRHYSAPISPQAFGSGFTETGERLHRSMADATARSVHFPTFIYRRSPIRSKSMKIPSLAARVSACALLTLFSPLTLAQTCVAGIQASNPASVYVVDSANGTVTDTRTGLMWDRCARGLSGTGCATGAATTFTWQGALTAAGTIGTYKGFSDWRLPNLKELRSLVEECRINPSINEFAFPNTPAFFFLVGFALCRGRDLCVGRVLRRRQCRHCQPQQRRSSSTRSRRTVNLPFFGWWAGNSFCVKRPFHMGVIDDFAEYRYSAKYAV